MKSVMRRRVWLSVLTCILLVMSLVVTTYAEGTKQHLPTAAVRVIKIADDLNEVLANAEDDDLIPVYVWLKSVDEGKIKNRLKNEKGMDADIYETPERFQAEVATQIIMGLENRLVAEANKEKRDTLVENSVSDEADRYITAKREIVKEENIKENAKFLDENYKNKNREVIYNSRYTSTLVLELTPKEIAQIVKDPRVEEVSLHEEQVQVPELDAVLTQIRADGSTGTKSANFNGGAGYKGTNIKVGVIEAGSGRFDSNAAQLAGLEAAGRLVFVSNTGVTPTISTHATFVTTLIVGKAVTIGSRTYEGVVPNATVYQTPVSTTTHLYNGFQKLADLGVHIINYSAGSDTGTTYSATDREIDRLIYSTGVTFTKSAGNNGANVTSPGKAYNAITVGNTATKSGSTVLSAPYSMASSSSYITTSYLPNKPDIAAPGTSLTIAMTTSTTHTGSGTSYAAPLVAGVLAQMMQASSGLRMNPHRSKATLMEGAERSRITGDTVAYGQLNQRSGAGFVNAVNAVNQSLATSRVLSRTFNLFNSTHTPATQSIYLTSGQRIRVVMAYNKPQNIAISSRYHDLNVRLKNPSGTIVASSTSANNNVEIFEFTATTTGNHTLEIIVQSATKTSTNVYLDSVAVWSIK